MTATVDSPLHLAVRHPGSVVTVRRLLTDGNPVDIRNARGSTPLGEATANDVCDYVRILLEAGADVDAVDNSGNSPLIVAATMGHLDMVELLLVMGSRVDLCNGRGETALSHMRGHQIDARAQDAHRKLQQIERIISKMEAKFIQLGIEIDRKLPNMDQDESWNHQNVSENYKVSIVPILEEE